MPQVSGSAMPMAAPATTGTAGRSSMGGRMYERLIAIRRSRFDPDRAPLMTTPLKTRILVADDRPDIVGALRGGDKVNISGFGTFAVSARKARTGSTRPASIG